jgi:DNA-binding NarL/FixJ family response regulator
MLLHDQPVNIPNQQETLSERETDVLKLLVTGNANKEIADKLNISTNTVITHRKNISQNTGIKSVSGLTIYAVVNNYISIDSYHE